MRKIAKIFGILSLVSAVCFIFAWFIPSGNILIDFFLVPISLISTLLCLTAFYEISTGHWDMYFKDTDRTEKELEPSKNKKQ